MQVRYQTAPHSDFVKEAIIKVIVLLSKYTIQVIYYFFNLLTGFQCINDGITISIYLITCKWVYIWCKAVAQLSDFNHISTGIVLTAIAYNNAMCLLPDRELLGTDVCQAA